MAFTKPGRRAGSKLSAAQRSVRASRKVLRAMLRDTVKTSSLLSGPVPDDDCPKLELRAENYRVPAALREEVLAFLAERVRFARRHWNRAFRMPSVSFDLRGTTAGTADALEWRVSLNPVLLVENPEVVAIDTAGHELAHLLTCSLYGGASTSHGKHWQSVMRALGLQPDRTHTMDVMNAATGKELYKYACGCRLWPIRPPKHEDYRSGLKWAICKGCDQRIVYTGEVRLKGSWYKDPKSLKRAAPSQPPVPRVRSAAPVVPGPTVSRSSAPSARPSSGSTSRVVSGPSPSRVTGGAPSDAMRRYAWDLARKLNMSLTAQQLSSASVLGAFVEHAKKLMAAGIPGVPADPGSPGGTAPDAPTERQLAFAEAIAKRRGRAPDAATLGSRRRLSAWIDANKG